MRKLPFTKDELVEQYKKDIDEMLDICDWKSHIDDYDVINAISNVCSNNGLIIDSKYLSKEYKEKIASLNLTDEQDKITKQGIKEVEFINLATTTNTFYNTTTVNRATKHEPTTLPSHQPQGPPPPARRPKTNGASTQTAYKPTQSTATGSGDLYFAGIG